MSVELDDYKNSIKKKQETAQSQLEALMQQLAPLQQRQITPSQRNTTYEDLYKQYVETPMSKEEEDKRKRAATAVNGIAGLGNVANAFANLIYTGKGAPSQTLPTYKGADLQAFSDKAAQARRLYGEAAIKGRQLDDAAYNQQEANRRADEAYNADIQTKNYNMLVQLYDRQRSIDAAGLEGSRNAWNMGNTESQQALQQQNWDKNFNEQKRQNDRQYALSAARSAYEKQKDATYGVSGRGGSKKTALNTTTPLWDNKGTAYKFKSMSDMSSLANLVNMIGVDQDTKNAIQMAITANDEKALSAAYQSAIGKAMAVDKTGAVKKLLNDAELIEPYYAPTQQGKKTASSSSKNDNIPPSMRASSKSTSDVNVPPSMRNSSASQSYSEPIQQSSTLYDKMLTMPKAVEDEEEESNKKKQAFFKEGLNKKKY